MELGLDGRCALVTAASKGLGKACAAALASEGARVFVNSRDATKLVATASEIGAVGYRAGDISSAADVEAVVASAVDALGGLDILVVNAGGPAPGTFTDLDERAWESGWNLILMSAVRILRRALPHLKRSDQARVAILTSISVRQPIPNLLLSNAYRSAVTAVAKSVAFELGQYGITVNCIAPDAVLTDRIAEVQADIALRRGISLDRRLAEYEASIPVRRFGRPDELGALCAYLCSARAGYITGQTIGIDGGLLAGIH